MKKKTPYQDTASAGAPHPRMVNRSVILMSLAGVLFVLLLLRILIYQTKDFQYYQSKVLEQLTTEADVSASRGRIYDANGVLLATNITTYRIFISPSSINTAQVEHNKTGDGVNLSDLIAGELSGALGVSYEFITEQIAKTRYLDRTLVRGADEATAEAVREIIGQYGLHQMVYLEPTSTRYYPYSTLASHVLGFTGSDSMGLYGLEYTYQSLLRGTDGRYITARDAQGNEMPWGNKEYIEAVDGYDLYTTIDVFVQSALEEELKAAYINSGAENRAAGIVMNVNTGEILGMATYPNFDLNDPRTIDADSRAILEASGLTPGSEEYNQKQQELMMRMWSNKAITESYIPGSTFKIITGAMALEEDAVKVDDSFTCTGHKTVVGHRIHCHKLVGHGVLTFSEGIQQSCNPVLMSVGERLGATHFYNYLSAFGFTEKTGIDLPGEGSSLYADREAFTDLDLAIYSFGQNFNVTLLQQITAISAVANGGYLVTPHLVSAVKDREGNLIKTVNTNVRRQVISASTAATMSAILEEGVSGEGGAKNAYVPGYRIAAKTGTSEKKDAGALGKYICSTVAYAPAEDPQYAVIIMVDEPTQGILYGSVVAAPYVGNVMETILPYLGVDAVYTDEELEKTTVKIPDCRFGTVEYIKKYYGDRYQIEVVGDPDGVVYKQYPEAGTVVEKEAARVILYTSRDAQNETTVVPDVTGLSAVAANAVLTNAGLNIRIEGTKNYGGSGVRVVSQSLQKGTVVARGTVITVEFLYTEGTE